jgi:formylglycine-generating enzyme required for sulfatase activity
MNDGIVGKTGETLKVPLCSTIVTVPIDGDIFGTKLQLKEDEVTVITAKAAPRVKKDAMVMLPGGSYTTTMEYTNREVTVKPFLLDVAEVTARAYRSCVWFGKCTKPIHETRKKSLERLVNKYTFGEGFLGSRPDIPIFYGCTYGESGKENHPINCVNWEQADAYCSWVGKRLPTEEEWGWAARGAERGTAYPWGNEAPTYDHLCQDGEGGTHELRMQRGFSQTCAVGAYPLGDSPQGIKDLGGNVAEWTSSKDTDSPGSGDRELRVHRGDYWGTVGSTSEYRNGSWKRVGTPIDPYAGGRSELPNRARNSIGFRCAKTP